MSITLHHNKIIGLMLVGLSLGGCWPWNNDGSNAVTSSTSGDNPTPENNSGGNNTPVTGIGPDGGTVAGYYSAKVLIPAGALTTTTDVAITRDGTGAPQLPTSEVDTAGAPYALTPHGTSFLTPVTVSVPFDADRIPTDANPVLYKAEPGGTFTPIPTTVNNDMLEADVSDFSWVIPGYAATRPRMVYALTDGGAKVSSFKITRSTGALSAATSSAPVGANPISVSVHPSRRFAYVTNAGTATANGIAPNSISVYPLDPVTGAISGPTDTHQANGNPIAAVIHPTGKFVYVVNEVRFGTPVGNISVFTVDAATGALSAPVTTADSGGAPATAIAFSPSGQYAYVTYMHATSTPSGNTYWDTVKTYAVNHSNGQLSSPIGSAATGDTPWAIAVTPGGHYAYVASLSTQNSVNELSTYSIDQSTGVLSLQSSLAFQGGKPASLAMDPEGRYLYVGKQQPYYNQNLAVYSINATNGSLGSGVWGGLTGSGSLVGPISVVAEPQGEFVYAMDINGEIAPFHLNAATGELIPSGSAVTGVYLGGGTIGVGDPFFFAASGTSPVWENGCTTVVDNSFVFDGCFTPILGSGSGGGSGGGTGGGSNSPSTHYLNTTILSWGGTVVSTPAGINYSTIDLAKNASAAGFPSNSSVQLCLTQTDNVQAYDVKWTGSGGCGGTSSCTSVNMNHDQSCSVDLTPVSTR